MAYETKNNVLVLHKNKYKTEDKHPSYRGEVIVEGAKKDASMWINTNKNGEKYIRIVLDEPYIKKASSSTDSTTPPKFNGDDDIPF